MAQQHPLLTVYETAEQLRISAHTVYTLIRRGQLPAVKVGREYRIRRAVLESYLDGDKHPSNDK